MGEPERINGHTKLVYLIGSPVAHSLSPAMHNLSFEHLGLDVVYLAADIKQDDLADVITGFKKVGGLVGCNVTMPLKRTILPFLDSLSDAAELMQAANVVYFHDRKAFGHNTDGVGFMDNLRKHGFEPEGKTMTLLGPGGAGTAILTQAALDGTGKINVFARRNGSSHKMAEELIPRIMAKTDCDITLYATEDLDDLQNCLTQSDILVNATSVGMGEGCTDTPVPSEMLDSHLCVADAIYFPRKTQLLKDAEACGCKTIQGLGMLLEQAAAGEKIWFDVDMPVDLVREAIYS